MALLWRRTVSARRAGTMPLPIRSLDDRYRRNGAAEWQRVVQRCGHTGRGAGLLIGIERERRKGEGPGRALAGLRTFALVCVTGAAAALTQTSGLVVAGAFSWRRWGWWPTGATAATTRA
ncbi:MgtC/SapB family protein [Hydrogenophaga taeniospiralis]|uniref:MgtC/SapB family protein n=1 Tax=Hydrogenophaga taeniospiralis TaxID=65656 RepID=UPI001CFA871F|nr:MgtC/SapB family protein [Hydrogenophaga taeniospiralis]MCB4363576.1 MgtC/SapB family protein [Hydrogenophaga taeniospiralis]